MHSPLDWACFPLSLDFGSWEIGIVCRSGGTQACGKPDLPSPGLASFTLHALGRTEPAPSDLMPPNSHLPSPSLAQVLLLAQLQCCSQYSSEHKVLLGFGVVALMVRAETSQDGHSVVPPTVWFFCSSFQQVIAKMGQHFPMMQKCCGVYHKGSFWRWWWKAGDLQDTAYTFLPVSNCW